VESFFDSRGQSLVREITAARDKASAGLEFETAAALHAQVEKLKPVLAQLPEIVHRLDRLRALMIQPSALPDSVTFFRIEHGWLSDPVPFRVNLQGELAATAEKNEPVGPGAPPGLQLELSESSAAAGASARGKKIPHSMESRVTEALAAAPPMSTPSRQEAVEHLGILKRWYYRSSKTGEIFFADDAGQLPMRRVVRGISRVFRGEKPTPDLNETARDYWINRGREAEMNGRG
jgi:hypothetical protein